MSTDHGGTRTAQAASQGKGGWIALGLITVTSLAIAIAGVVKRAVEENRVEALASASAPKEKDLNARMAELRELWYESHTEALAELERTIETGTIPERQGALAILGEVKDPRATAILNRWLDSLDSDRLPPECRLDLIAAASNHKTPEIEAKLAAYEAKQPKDNPMAYYHDALVGGNADRGRQVFMEKPEAQCVRCHKIDGGGGEVGPELTGVGTRHPREYILESIILPNKEIAKNFEGVVLALADGTILSGVLKGEDDKAVNVMTAEGKLVVVPKDDVEERKAGASAMPADLTKGLSKFEIRDLVEFLSESKEKPQSTEKSESKQKKATT